jgi:hypothetical protein
MKFNRICKGAYKTEINGKKVLIQNTYESNGMGRTLWDIIIETKSLPKMRTAMILQHTKIAKNF